eukprot:2491733-Pleurochrysis_carterae.AAC.2
MKESVCERAYVRESLRVLCVLERASPRAPCVARAAARPQRWHGGARRRDWPRSRSAARPAAADETDKASAERGKRNSAEQGKCAEAKNRQCIACARAERIACARVLRQCIARKRGGG